MALKKIRHAIFEWFDPDGTRHYAYRGDEVEVPDHVVEAFAKFEPFFEDGEDAESADEGELLPAETVASAASKAEQANVSGAESESRKRVDPPKATALKSEWVDYAVKYRDLDRAEAESMTKDDLIEALT